MILKRGLDQVPEFLVGDVRRNLEEDIIFRFKIFQLPDQSFSTDFRGADLGVILPGKSCDKAVGSESVKLRLNTTLADVACPACSGLQNLADLPMLQSRRKFVELPHFFFGGLPHRLCFEWRDVKQHSRYGINS